MMRKTFRAAPEQLLYLYMHYVSDVRWYARALAPTSCRPAMLARACQHHATRRGTIIARPLLHDAATPWQQQCEYWMRLGVGYMTVLTSGAVPSADSSLQQDVALHCLLSHAAKFRSAEILQ